MATKSSKKAKKKLRYAYRVRYHQFNDIRIERLEYIKVTKTRITYISEYGTEFTDVKVGPSHRWFPKLEGAQAFAVKRLNERIEFYHGVIDELKHCATLVRQGKVMVGIERKMIRLDTQ